MKRVGVIGGGQLAWMMGGAAKKLGVELIIQTPSNQDPAVSIAQDNVLAAVDDAQATKLLAAKSDVITFENEFVNLEALSLLAKQGICFRPRLEALSPLLDKYHQRCYLRDLGLPVPQFFAVEPKENLTSKIADLGFPLVLKSRRHGYDGQGTFIIHDLETLQQKLAMNQTIPTASQSLFLVEEFVPFERELAVIAARSVEGEVVIYPVVETQQEQQVCRRVIAPADITPHQAAETEAIAHTLLNSLQAVGVFGIELFLTPAGKVLVNEIAPRTHNSGHFSLDACETSQFEQHLRAVCGLPLGNPQLQCATAVMINLLGYENSHSDYQDKRQKLAQIPQAHVHWYNKSQSRPGRKLGHVTVLLENHNPALAAEIAHSVESIWY
ncbi:phosphoribosylaminoimidazole carboxylase, PurK protein [Nostoc sp. PCC 7524]|uniref:5-(carboxyamino)imidazole ribonucleotide synthase n=1 Tax=Nostoc sp. (strain ATCC 29411 / PCC 7524) TaxID=28072 RepID=UPI00029F0933|nr:5-(carboxyamino)imidazole ribonucleotide synthase [Nostoc sp. PCC 7524]AFY48116.1 phosphoribosylaminoimidazole carboxylase, PurK protein [Nostoc sp. PCC 7524]